MSCARPLQVGELWDARRDAWRASGKREADAGERAQMLREVLAVAPLLGRGSACTIPPFDGTAEGHALSREQGLARLAERCKKDVRAMLYQNDPQFTFAPMRVGDLMR